MAQRFTPSQFWLARHEVELAMLHEVNQTIYQEGHATVEGLQLLVVEFQPVSDRANSDHHSPLGAIRRIVSPILSDAVLSHSPLRCTRRRS